jgi:hypothetical protein
MESIYLLVVNGAEWEDIIVYLRNTNPQDEIEAAEFEEKRRSDYSLTLALVMVIGSTGTSP